MSSSDTYVWRFIRDGDDALYAHCEFIGRYTTKTRWTFVSNSDLLTDGDADYGHCLWHEYEKTWTQRAIIRTKEGRWLKSRGYTLQWVRASQEDRHSPIVVNVLDEIVSSLL